MSVIATDAFWAAERRGLEDMVDVCVCEKEISGKLSCVSLVACWMDML